MAFLVHLRQSKKCVREVDWESSPKRGSDKINMLKEGRDTQKKIHCIIQPGLMDHSTYRDRFATHC